MIDTNRLTRNFGVSDSILHFFLHLQNAGTETVVGHIGSTSVRFRKKLKKHIFTNSCISLNEKKKKKK